MKGLIFQNLLDNINQTSTDISSFIKDTKLYDLDIFNILIRLPPYFIIIYILIIFIIFNFLSRFNIRLNDIFSLFISIIILYFLIKGNFKNFSNYTKLKDIQLDFLHKLIFENEYSYALKDDFLIKPHNEKTYLYTDPLIIDFFYNIKDVSQYNITSFTKSIIHCNNILGLCYEAKIGLNREYFNYETIILESKKALNELNSVIYNIPSSIIIFNKFRNSMLMFQKLLNQHIYDIGLLFKSNNNLDDINLYKRPDNFYDEYFFISPNDTKTENYHSVYNMY